MKKKAKKGKLAVGVAWYRPHQYAALLELSEDRSKMHSNYLDWEKTAIESTQQLRNEGLEVEIIDMDLKELQAWCANHNLSINGKARAEFVLEKVQAKHKTGR